MQNDGGSLLREPPFSLSKNAHHARAKMGVLVYVKQKNERKAKKSEGWYCQVFFAN